MDVQTIAQRARLPVRNVRYILDQHILPGLRGRLQTHRAGRPRFFTEREGYLIALAALLLEGGVQRRTVTQVLARLADLPWPLPETRPPPPRLKERVLPQPRTLLEAMYLAPLEPAEFLVGDGVNL